MERERRVLHLEGFKGAVGPVGLIVNVEIKAFLRIVANFLLKQTGSSDFTVYAFTRRRDFNAVVGIGKYTPRLVFTNAEKNGSVIEWHPWWRDRAYIGWVTKEMKDENGQNCVYVQTALGADDLRRNLKGTNLTRVNLVANGRWKTRREEPECFQLTSIS